MLRRCCCIACRSAITSRAAVRRAKLKIADAMKDGPRHYEEIASATGTHAPSLNRVMRLLASAGVSRKTKMASSL